MGKRGNENSQMRREDYEALSSRGGGGEGPGRFQHATPQELSKRRVVKARRSMSREAASSISKAAAVAPAPATVGGEAKKTTGNPFEGFSFGDTKPGAFNFGGAGGSNSSSSTTPPAPAPKVTFNLGGATPAATTATPTFTFGATPATTNKPNATGTPAPFSFTNKGSSSSSTLSDGNSVIVRRYQNQACAFERSYLEKCKEFNPKYTDMMPLLDYYLDAQHVLETEYWKQCKETGEALKGNSTKAGSTPYPAAKPAPSPSPSFGGGGSLFGGASAAPAPAPAGNLFGGAVAAATTKAPSPGGSTKLFGVGTTTAGTGTGTSFSFTAGKTSSSNPPPASSVATPASAFTGGAGGGGEDASDNPAAANEPSSVQKGDADKDWDKVEELIGVTHVYVLSDKKWNKQFNGTLKVQEHKQNKTKRLIMRDDAVGNVRLNMLLPAEMTFQTATTPKKQLEAATFAGQLMPEEKAGVIQFKRRLEKDAPTFRDVFVGLGVKEKAKAKK